MLVKQDEGQGGTALRGDGTESGREEESGAEKATAPGAGQALSREMLEGLPEIALARLRLAERLAVSLRELTPEQRQEFVARMSRVLGGSQAASLVNQFSMAMLAVHRENPDLAAELYPAIDAAFEEIDFGKLREATAAFLVLWTDLAARAIEDSTANPLIIANLAGIIAPFLNDLVRLGADLLENIDLPAEILASAVFNITLELDAVQLGRAVNAAARTVSEIHTGSRILGGDEPRLREVFTRFAGDLLDSLDPGALAAALEAAARDMEVVVAAGAEVVSRDPDAVEAITFSVATLAGSIARAASSVLQEMSGWPDEYLAVAARQARTCLDPEDAARACNSLVEVLSRMREQDPLVGAELITRAVHEIDAGALEGVGRGIFADVSEALKTHPGVRSMLEPEEVGSRINELLVAFNRSTGEGSGPVRDYLTRVMAQVDDSELEQAWNKVLEGALEAFLSGRRRLFLLLGSIGRGLVCLGRSLAGIAAARVVGAFSGKGSGGTGSVPPPGHGHSG